MAFGSNNIHFRSHGVNKKQPMSDINVTPMVDVMLVLLVIFMVTAPLLTVGVPVELPKTQAMEITQQTEPLVISIDAAGKIFVQETDSAVIGLSCVIDFTAKLFCNFKS